MPRVGSFLVLYSQHYYWDYYLRAEVHQLLGVVVLMLKEEPKRPVVHALCWTLVGSRLGRQW